MTDATVLLGAGASNDAGIPTSAQLVDRVGDRITDDPRLHAIYDAINAGCLMRSASSRISGVSLPWPTIEDVANTIDALIDHKNSDIAPFVAVWSPLLAYVDEAEDVSHATRQAVAKVFQQKFVDASRGETDTIDTNWASWAGDLIGALQPRPSADNLLRSLKRRIPFIIAELLAVPASADLSYLAPLLELRSEGEQLTIATLNYDLTIEVVCGKSKVSYSDGLESWIGGEPNLFGNASIALHKLHGSLDWERDAEDHYRRKIVTVDPAQPGIIFGGRNKLTTRGPYLDLLWRWRTELALKSTLVVIGYSFADSHVNGLLIQWARTTTARRLVIVSRSTSWHSTRTGQWLLTHATKTKRFELVHVAGTARTGTPRSVEHAMRPL